MKRVPTMIAGAAEARSIYREVELPTPVCECREGSVYPAISASMLKMRIELAPVI